MRFTSVQRLLLVLVALAACGSSAGARAVEPVDQFLEALWQRRYYDEATDYLKLLPTMDYVPERDRQRARYEQGRTLVESARYVTDLKARNAQLERATAEFQGFQKAHPQHDLASLVESQLGNCLVERGRTQLRGEDKSAASTAARKLFEEARKHFATAEKTFDGQLQKLPKLIPPGESQLQEQKSRALTELTNTRMLLASIDYELARTYPAGGKDAQQHLKSAAQRYGTLYEKNRLRAGGQLARLWEGRCYEDMGELKQALGCFLELLDQPSKPETRAIKTKSTRHALECWTAESEKKFPEAIEYGERWEKDWGSGPNDTDALAIRYYTAKAYQAQAETLGERDPNRRKYVGYARQYGGIVAEHPGEYQRPARMLLVALDAKRDRAQKSKDKAKAKSKSKEKESEDEQLSFLETLEKAKVALAEMQDADIQLKAAQASGEKANITTLTKQKSDSAKTAREALEQALAVSTSKTSADDLNEARYYLCYLAWDSGRLYDAAVLGDFVARRYPDSPRAAMAARIALAAYVQMYSDSKSDDKTFETRHIEQIAEYIFKRWPGQEEADAAALALLNFAAAQQQYDKLPALLAKIPVASPRRGQAELRTGQTLWSTYLRALQAPADQRPPQAKLDELKKQAAETLAQGMGRMEKVEEIDALVAGAAFTLAQMAIEDGHPDQAIQWLENPKFGPLTLLRNKSPLAARDGFAAETYKLALRAYIGVSPQELQKAEGVMNALDRLVQSSGDAKAADNLTAIYMGLGRELQQHLQTLRTSGKTKELQSVSKAFEAFLDRVTKRGAGNSFASLNWVGETYYNLGTAFDASSPALAEQAKTYFGKATTAYEKMLEMAEKEPKYQDNPQSLTPMRLRLADCYRRAGKYEDAIKTLLVVLRKQPSLINAQMQAAQTHQSRAAGDPAAYAQAIWGSNPGKDGANVVWGWSRLSKVADANYAQFADTFHEARLQMAEARYLYGLSDKKDPKRAKGVLETAKKDLWYTFQLHSDLGGKDTMARYDRLLKQIQKQLGEKETGLEEFKQRDEAASKDGAKVK